MFALELHLGGAQTALVDIREQAILQAVGMNLRVARIRSGQTQEGLARRAGMHTTQVARMERGEVSYGVAKLVRLAWALDVTPAAMFDGLEQP